MKTGLKKRISMTTAIAFVACMVALTSLPVMAADSVLIDDKMDAADQAPEGAEYTNLAFLTTEKGDPLAMDDAGWVWGNVVKPKDMFGYIVEVANLGRSSRKYAYATYTLPKSGKNFKIEANVNMIFASYSADKKDGGFMDGWPEGNGAFDISKITPKYISSDGQAWIVRSFDTDGNPLANPQWARFAKDKYSYILENNRPVPNDPKRQLLVEYTTNGTNWKEVGWNYKSVIDLNDRGIETIECVIPKEATKVRLGLTMPLKTFRSTVPDSLTSDDRTQWGSQCGFINVKISGTGDAVTKTPAVPTIKSESRPSNSSSSSSTSSQSTQTSSVVQSETSTTQSANEESSKALLSSSAADEESTLSSNIPTEGSESEFPLSTGAIVGIIIAAVVILGGGGAVVFFLLKKKKA